MKRSFFFSLLVVIAVSLAGGCAFIPGTSGVDQDEVATQSAVIIEQARMTATTVALQTQVADLSTRAAQVETQASLPTDTPVPTSTPVPHTQTPLPTATFLPTFTPLPSFTPVPPLPTATPIPCDLAGFVSDVTIPDGTVVSPGQTFTKIWRIKNNGTCTWSTSYSLVFSSGERMGGSSPQALSANIRPGETIDLSVSLTAPTADGKYRSSWKLRNASGSDFGLGSRSSAFYADIEVKSSPSGYALDFTNSYCAAEWSSGSGTLSCPGTDGDSKGFVLRVDGMVLETGTKDDEAGLVMQPQAITDGVIRGKYPVYRVKDGEHFKALVMCASTADNCDVKFQLDYQIGSDAIQTLGTWNEINDEKYRSVDVDLSGLVGKDVKFILTVMANGAMNQDRAQWLSPRIVK